ncbi:MAG: murein L,D-transpeptidase catalytic domain family protein [Flavobacteriales bacterium]|nr:murein L,D-transpeptidase catalytic domain family protein [Flavobacteriales bacterium]
MHSLKSENLNHNKGTEVKNSTLQVLMLLISFILCGNLFADPFKQQIEQKKIAKSILPSITEALAPTDSINLNLLELASCEFYEKINFNKHNALNYNVFQMAYKGYLVMKKEGMLSNFRYLSILDFELSANAKRLWVIDLEEQKVIIHDLVSHGRNSGEEFANSFSNRHQSFQSSLGFYVTGMPYLGKNAYSLKLHGVETGFNDNAFDRGIVIHAADYVSQSFIRHHKRLGRSQGCPAVNPGLNKKLINVIQGGSCLFIYYPDQAYLRKSEILNSWDPSNEFPFASNYALN